MVKPNMPPDDGRYKPFTPSEAHDSAYRRDAGHDEMQLAVLKWLRATRRPLPINRQTFEYAGSEAEFAFRDSGRIYGFADIGVRYSRPGTIRPEREESAWRLFEIKPIIHSAGAVIRQCHVLASLGERFLKEEFQSGKQVTVTAVVAMNDPKIEVLKALSRYDVLVWDSSLNVPAEWVV